MPSRNFVNSEGVSDTILKYLSSEEASKHNKNNRTTNSTIEPGKIRVAEKGSYPESRNSSRGVSELPFSCRKEALWKPSAHKSEKTRYIQLLHALQNRSFALSEIFSRTKRFAVQGRSPRRLLRNSSQQRIIEIC